MISAPWARFTIFRTPQTSPIPRPIRPYNPPSRIPLTRICPKSCKNDLPFRKNSAAEYGGGWRSAPALRLEVQPHREPARGAHRFDQGGIGYFGLEMKSSE